MAVAHIVPTGFSTYCENCDNFIRKHISVLCYTDNAKKDVVFICNKCGLTQKRDFYSFKNYFGEGAQ